jgi:iron complex transport system ATP-binding protein
MSPDPLLEFHEVSFRAGGQTILDRISWSIQSGEHWALLGPNGSGKTTLLRMATGFIWPNAGGIIRRCGRELLDLRQLRRSIGWVSSTLVLAVPPQEIAIDTVVSGRFAQFGLGRHPGCKPRDEDYAQGRALLEKSGCGPLIDRPFGVLSQGEQQQVLIARARMARPLLILLDEPCAGLDPGAREKLLAALADLLGDPQAPQIILVTHHLEEILPQMTHTLVLSQGRAVRSGLTREVVDEGLLERIFETSAGRIERAGGRMWPIWS